jgi:anti-sigma factor RsiW
MTAKPRGFSGIEADIMGTVMTCREFADFMADYLSGELAAETRAVFDEHLRVCANCKRYLAGYEETIKLGKRAFADAGAAVPDHVPEELVQAILRAKDRER